MKRTVALSVVLLAGMGSMALSAWQRGGQAQRSIAVDQVRDNLYVLKGGGGNTAVFVTADGVVVVDAKNPGWGQSILDKIREITPKPVTTLINTHTHGDHVGGNLQFPDNITVVAQQNTKAWMQQMPEFAQSGSSGLPTRTFTDRLTLGQGTDEIDLYYFGPGHTDGDAIVVFPALKAAHLGDLFAGKGLSLVDADHGGSALYYAETLEKAHAGIAGVETVINGHMNTTTTWDDLRVFAEFHTDVLNWMQSQVKDGRTPEQAAAAWTLPEKYRALGYSPNVSPLFGGMAGRLQRLMAEMQAR